MMLPYAEELKPYALETLVPWDRQRQLDRLAPTHVEVPSGSRVPIAYDQSAEPTLAVRLQEMFGLTDTPRIAGGTVPLTIHLLSPARRPVQVTRDLRMSNGERDTVAWLVRHQAALDDPAKPSLAEFKRLLAHQAFPALRAWADVRLNVNQQPQRALTLAERIAAIPAQSIAPPPFITGDDLIARQTPPGPLFKRVLDELYTRQLNDEWNTREEALAALDALLRETR